MPIPIFRGILGSNRFIQWLGNAFCMVQKQTLCFFFQYNELVKQQHTMLFWTLVLTKPNKNCTLFFCSCICRQGAFFKPHFFLATAPNAIIMITPTLRSQFLWCWRWMWARDIENTQLAWWNMPFTEQLRIQSQVQIMQGHKVKLMVNKNKSVS